MVTGLPLPAFGLRQPIWRDAGLMTVSVVAVAIAYVTTADSLAIATAASVAASTAAAMHARLAVGRWPAAVQVLAGGFAVSVLGAPPRLVGVLLITGLAGAALVVRCARRSAILRIGVWLALIAGVASASGLAADVAMPARAALMEGLAAVAGGFLSASLILTLGPMAEWAFGHVTRLSMSEWLSYEQPLLRRLTSAAPGTFQHSVNVGVLADAAAGAVGADALLARVGGLYHDVGKINAPEYFIENQHGPNPHDRLDPPESARILRAHVSDGVELVARHRMGDRIADFVREHHGTGEMRLLRDKAEALDRPPDDQAYRYPGPRPRSRETGIVMIADQIEATARAQRPEDDAACERLVRATVERIQGERQLEESGLTAADLAGVQRGFARALQAMYHRRLPYPAPPAAAVPRKLPFFRRSRGDAAS